MEEYFKKYNAEFEAQEVESPLTEENFMKYCRRRTIRRRLAIALPVTAVAAALALTLIFSFTGPKEKPSPDMVAVYISEFTNGVQPIYDDVVSMEGRSELCSALNLSSVMQEILESITALNEELAGVGQDLRLDTVRRYCEEQTERISDIYARCITSYTLDFNIQSDIL